jgi:hypothetical protein
MVYCKYKLNKQETVIVVFPLKQSNLNVGAKSINYLGDILTINLAGILSK